MGVRTYIAAFIVLVVGLGQQFAIVDMLATTRGTNEADSIATLAVWIGIVPIFWALVVCLVATRCAPAGRKLFPATMAIGPIALGLYSYHVLIFEAVSIFVGGKFGCHLATRSLGADCGG